MTRDVQVLERFGVIQVIKKPLPGHGKQKWIKYAQNHATKKETAQTPTSASRTHYGPHTSERVVIP